MDPLTTACISACIAGVTAGSQHIGKQLLVDAYQALNQAIKDRFGSTSEVAQALTSLETNPQSPGRQTTLHEEIIAVGADQDAQFQALAAKIQACIPPADQPYVVQQATGHQHVVAYHSTVTYTTPEMRRD